MSPARTRLRWGTPSTRVAGLVNVVCQAIFPPAPASTTPTCAFSRPYTAFAFNTSRAVIVNPTCVVKAARFPARGFG